MCMDFDVLAEVILSVRKKVSILNVLFFICLGGSEISDY